MIDKKEGGLRTKGLVKSSKKQPLVSVITVVYNGERYVEESIQSVLSQTYDNIEYIIIDGGSSDSTVEIIKKYEHVIDYWVSERDSGIYNAMNKGLRLATGDYIAILNADDYYNRDAVKLSIEAIQINQADYSYANVRFVGSNSLSRPIYPLQKDYIYQEMPYPHVSAFIKANIYKAVGFFDESFKIAADHDMALRIHLVGYKACYVDYEVARLEAGGVSSSSESNREYVKIVIKHGKNRFKSYFTYYKQRAKIQILKLLPENITTKILQLKKSRFR